ncbi:MAG: COP23 domain-containing protein [Planktothrix sp.]
MKNSVFGKGLQISAIAFSTVLGFASVSQGQELITNRSCNFGNLSACESSGVKLSDRQYTETIRQEFYCDLSSDGIPTTFVKNTRGTFPVIRWVSRIFDDAGYVPETRCRQVSSKFQQFQKRGLLNYVTTGRVNNQPVICVSNAQDGPCLGILFTLKPNQNANRTLQQLFDLRANASAGALEESNGRLYLDLSEYIQDQGSISVLDSVQLN